MIFEWIVGVVVYLSVGTGIGIALEQKNDPVGSLICVMLWPIVLLGGAIGLFLKRIGAY